jgi:hypothetical protein
MKQQLTIEASAAALEYAAGKLNELMAAVDVEAKKDEE